jgi:hypothetical protein
MEYKIKGHLICCINSINSKVLTLEIDVGHGTKNYRRFRGRGRRG